MDSIPRTSGIYKITCTVTGKIYIGSAVNLCIRKNEHWAALRRGDHANSKLQNAWNKYREASFVFEVLELILAPFLLEREQYYFQKLRPFDRAKGFNIHPTAGSPYGYKHSDEARRKMSEAQKRNWHQRVVSPGAHARRPGRKLTEEHRRKISLSLMGNKRGLGNLRIGSPDGAGTYQIFTPDGQELIIVNLAQFCKDNGLVNSRMRCVMHGQQDNHKGWRVKKIG